MGHSPGACSSAAKTPMTDPGDRERPRRETRQVARVLAITFGALFIIIFGMMAAALR
jgi:hypothetical protein